MSDLSLSSVDLPAELAVGLLAAWLTKLGGERLGLSQHGTSSSGDRRVLRFGDPGSEHFTLEAYGQDIRVGAIVGLDESSVRRLLNDALERIAVHDYGGTVVYEIQMTVTAMDFSSRGVQIARGLGDQIHIEGSRRLSDLVILDFEEGLLEEARPGEPLLAPRSTVKALIYVRCPCPSDLSRMEAAAIAELTAAVCALASGRPVEHSPPMFASEGSGAAAALDRRYDTSILGLARNHVSLDIFGELPALGGMDAFSRCKGSLLAYHAALQQGSADVAVMLFVTAIEALVAPLASWGRERVTQRFISALIELCPTAVDDIVAHASVGQAFGWRPRGGISRRRKELLGTVYQSRSTPTHTGLDFSETDPMYAMASPGSMRVSLLSDLARAAILAYIQAPRSSLVGHPGIHRSRVSY